jgi:hypothetical protein
MSGSRLGQRPGDVDRRRPAAKFDPDVGDRRRTCWTRQLLDLQLNERRRPLWLRTNVIAFGGQRPATQQVRAHAVGQRHRRDRHTGMAARSYGIGLELCAVTSSSAPLAPAAFISAHVST